MIRHMMSHVKKNRKNDQHNCTRYLKDNSMVRSLAKWMHKLDVYILQSFLAFFPQFTLNCLPPNIPRLVIVG
jgi:hypothetical protein